MLFEQHMIRSQNILHESCDGMNAVQRSIVEGIYNDLKPLIEASLTADQIQQLFKGVEQNVSATGNNRTLLGKGKDIAAKGVEVTKQANEIINKIGRWLQDTTPVKMADQKFEQLKSKVATKFPELDKQLTSMGTWMKENPGKSAAIIGVLTALASLAGGPVGGAIAGQVLRGASELMKGEKLSTAVGKGIKTAALGYISGKAFDMLGDWVAGFREQSIPFGPEEAGLEQISWQAQKTMSGFGTEWKQTTQGFNALVRPEEAEAIRNAVAGIQNGDVKAFDTLMALGKEVRSKEYMAGLDAIKDGAWKAAKENDSLLKWIEGIKTATTAVSQGAVAAAGAAGDGKAPAKESLVKKNKPLSEGQVYLMFDKVCATNNQMLSEGKIWEADDPAAPKMSAWDKIKAKASDIGKNLTTKVTASKLTAAWKKAGQPTDSDELAAFLQKQGVNREVVTKTYSDMKLAPPKATGAAQPKASLAAQPKAAPKGAAPAPQVSAADKPTTPAEQPAQAAVAEPGAPQQATGSATEPAASSTLYSQVKVDIAKLDKKGKQRLAAYLQKQLGTV